MKSSKENRLIKWTQRRENLCLNKSFYFIGEAPVAASRPATGMNPSSRPGITD